MSNINARVPPSRLAAIDSPADGEVAAYQSSSGQFEWVANGSGGGGTVSSVALTETGSALTITGSPITGAGTFNIAGAGTSSQVILGDLSLATLPTGTVSSVALTETGSALTITGSPITGAGTFNIAGAGTSSQVILGDLSLGTLTSGTITGTGSANQVSYWTAASVQAGSTGLTYNPSTGDLTVGGYVETGTKITTPSGTNLELVPGGASSGSIVIADGANGQISLNPNGTGVVKIDGVEINNSAIATGYVLKATSATAAGWAAESGGSISFPIEADSGSSGAPSYSFSADTDTGIYLSGASNMGIAAGGQNYLFIGSLGSVQFNKKALFNAATAAAPNGFATDTNTGFFQPSADTIGFSTAGTERLRFGSNGEILVGGTAAGTSGQVLTSGGSGAAVSWTTVSGGSGSPGGSDSQIQYNNGGSFGGSSVMTFDDTASAEQVLFSGSSSNPLVKIVQTGGGHAFEVHDAATDTSIFSISETGAVSIKTATPQAGGLTVNDDMYVGTIKNSSGGSQTNPRYTFNSDTNTGMFSPSADNLAFTTAGTERIRYGSSGEIGIAGANYGTSGQVLTSGGSGAAASWTTVSGGGGSSYNQARNPNGNIYTGYSIYYLSRGVGFTSIGQLTTTSSTRSGYSRQTFRPFIAPETGNITAFLAVVSTASADTDIEVSIYNDNGGVPDDLIGKATIDCSSTGSKTQTTISATISLTEGTQYWYAWVSTNAIGSPTLRAEAQSQTQFATGQTNNIGGTDYGVILVDLGSTYTTSTSITRTNLLPSGNTGGACRLGVKY